MLYLPLISGEAQSAQFTAEIFVNTIDNQHTDIQPTGDGRLFLVAQKGIIYIIDNGVIQSDPYLDISDRVEDTGDERGLYGITLHPDFANNGYFFVSYSRADDPINCASPTNYCSFVVSRFSALDANQADPNSELIILDVEKLRDRHHGGALNFGPLDGYLYVTVGDDVIQANSQDGQNLLGTVLRIDVESADSVTPYTIPPDNPFVGDPNVLDEIWAMGLRNPWRMRFDQMTGDAYITDVGNMLWEEINVELAGAGGGHNYGWPCYEGHVVNDQTQCDDLVTYTPPVHAYGHSSGRCAITGGDVYRGALHPSWHGKYIYGDFCSFEVFSLTHLGNNQWQTQWLGDVPWFLSTFGTDGAGEIYVGSFNSATIYKLLPIE